jgi:hypothetical protein
VRCLDTGVDHVDAGALAGRFVIVVSRGTGAGAGDASKAPGSVGLRSVDGDNSILLNVLNLTAILEGRDFLGEEIIDGKTYIGMGAENPNHVLVKGRSETTEDVLVDVVGLARNLLHGSIESRKSATLLELDNVLVGNHLAAGLDQRSSLGALLNGRSAESEGKKTQKNRQTHFGCC